MRPLAVAALALGAAIIGGAVVYLLGGRDTDGSSRPASVVVGEIDAAAGSRAASAPLPAGSGFDPERVYAARAPGVVTLYSYFGGALHAAQGSGFVVSPDGYILTSAHVITTAGSGSPTAGAKDVYVAFSDGDRVKASMVGWDLFDDVG